MKGVWTLVLWVAVGSQTAVAAISDGLIGHWTLDDGRDEVARDASGNGNHGKLEGKGKWVVGVHNGALDFARDAQTKVTVANAKALNPTQAISLTAWVKSRSVYIGNDWKQRNCVAAKVRSYYLDFNEKGLVSSYIYGPQPEQWVSGTTDTSKRTGDWFHVAMTYSGKEHLVYVDAKIEARLARNGNIRVDPGDFYLGFVDNSRYFDGAIDDVRLYDRALSADEVRELATLAVRPSGKTTVVWAALKRM